MIDLHLHLDGSLDPRIIPTLAKMAGVTLSCEDANSIITKMTVSPDCTSLGEYLEKFELPLMLLQTAECIEYAVYELMRDIKAMGLLYAEVRFAPQLHLQKGLTQAKVVQAAIRGRDSGMRDFKVPVNLILCCMRDSDNYAQNVQTVTVAQKFMGKGVCAVDLAGNEAAFPTESFKNIFTAAKENGVPIIIHAGEAAGPDSIRQALALGAVRIGHGIRAALDAELMRILKEKKIYLEMCYTSNLQTKAVDSAENYPLAEFVAEGIGVTLNTDNLTVSGTDLKKEYLLVQNKLNVSDDTLKSIAVNTADAAFLPPEQRQALKERIEREFTSWLHS